MRSPVLYKILVSKLPFPRKVCSSAFALVIKGVALISKISSSCVSDKASISFTVKDSSGTTKSVTGISSADGNNNTKNIILTLGSDVDITKTYTVSSTQFKEKQAVMGEIYSSSKFITSYTYSGSDLGATYSKNSTTFKVWAPIATDVTLNLYSAGNGGSAYKTVKMTKGTGGVWQTSVAGDLNKVYYTYSITNYGVKKEISFIFSSNS